MRGKNTNTPGHVGETGERKRDESKTDKCGKHKATGCRKRERGRQNQKGRSGGEEEKRRKRKWGVGERHKGGGKIDNTIPRKCKSHKNENKKQAATSSNGGGQRGWKQKEKTN